MLNYIQRYVALLTHQAGDTSRATMFSTSYSTWPFNKKPQKISYSSCVCVLLYTATCTSCVYFGDIGLKINWCQGRTSRTCHVGKFHLITHPTSYRTVRGTKKRNTLRLCTESVLNHLAQLMVWVEGSRSGVTRHRAMWKGSVLHNVVCVENLIFCVT